MLSFWTYLVAQMVKNLHAVQETRVRSLGWEDLLEKGMATPSSILAWRIPWTEEPGRLQSMGLQRIGHDWATLTIFSFWKWNGCKSTARGAVCVKSEGHSPPFISKEESEMKPELLRSWSRYYLAQQGRENDAGDWAQTESQTLRDKGPQRRRGAEK